MTKISRRRLIAVVIVGLAGILIAVLLIEPVRLDRSMNVVSGSHDYAKVSPEAMALHRDLMIVDLHADPLLWKRNILKRHDYGHVDLPRLVEGNVGLQVFASVTQVPAGQNYDSNPADSDRVTLLTVLNMQPVATWFSRYQRSIHHAEKLQRFERKAPSTLKLIRTASDMDLLLSSRKSSGKPVGILLAVEGAQNLEGQIDNVDGLFEAGYRMLGLAHFFDNDVAGSMHGIEKHGLTEFGRLVLSRAEKLGMVIDLAHSSPRTMDEVLNSATRPIVVSHGGVRATCDINRNLSDDQVRRIAEVGGLIGIGYWDAAVCDTSPQGIVSAMEHIRNLVGVNHIALGSDFDGGITAEFDTTGLVLLTQELMARGYRDSEIHQVMGGNAVRFFRENLPK